MPDRREPRSGIARHGRNARRDPAHAHRCPVRGRRRPRRRPRRPPPWCGTRGLKHRAAAARAGPAAENPPAVLKPAGRKPAGRAGYFTLAGQGIGRLSPGGRGAFSHSSVNRSWTGGQSYLRPSRRPLSIAAPRRAGARRARSRESARPMSGIISFPERRRRRSRSGPDILRRAPGRACAMVAPRLERPHP